MTLDLASALATLPFCEPLRLQSKTWREHLTQTPAVYRIRAWDELPSVPIVIPRLGGSDPLGLLDIGETVNGRRRVTDFLGAAEGRPRSHRAGRDFHDYDVASTVPLAALRVDVLALPSKEVAEALELGLLEDYRWRLKDRPPLNGSAGKYDKVAAWLESRGQPARTDDGNLNLLPLLVELGFVASR